MAYSSIGHMGFALVGLAAGTAEGVQGVLVYMAIYVAMTLGTFACILAMRRDGALVGGDQRPCAVSPRTNPALAFFLAMLLFSLAGIPPLAGFFAKFYVFWPRSRRTCSRSPSSACSPASWAPTTTSPSSRSCTSTSQRRTSARCRHELKAVLGGERSVQSPVLRLSGPAGRGGNRGCEVAVLK